MTLVIERTQPVADRAPTARAVAEHAVARRAAAVRAVAARKAVVAKRALARHRAEARAKARSVARSARHRARQVVRPAHAVVPPRRTVVPPRRTVVPPRRTVVTRHSPAIRRQRPAASRGGMTAVIAYARSQVGKRYVSGGAGGSGFDCSGLTMRAYERAGIRLPHSSGAQAGRARTISRSQARAGDLVIGPGHVGIYMGNGMMIDAGNHRTGVVYRKLYGGLRVARL